MASLSMFKGGPLRVRKTDGSSSVGQVPVSILISKSQVEFLEQVAEERGKSLEEICRHAIAAYIYAIKHKEKNG